MKKVLSQDDLKENIKKLIDTNEKPQSALARFIGVDPDIFSGYINGKKRRINAAWIPAIAHFYNVTIDYIYGEQNSSESGATSPACSNDNASQAYA
jgi:predicted transcriptional regulator